ncbi:hypothetical protein NC651_018282 [Populus alba x Populus x berolinensis]|nr:hypothetical protein NC651_018282 [Populus alba x Populus x berolinensis]
MNSINWAAYISFLLCHFLLVNDSHGASDHLGPFKSDISIPALFRTLSFDGQVQDMYVKCMDLDEQIELFKSSLKSFKNLDDLSRSLISINMGQNDMDLNKRLSSNGSRLYDHGGRKFLVSNSLLLGCRPFLISQEKPTTRCVERLNKLASEFNNYLPRMLEDLDSTLSGSKFVLLDVYKVFEDVFSEPASYGITDITHSCCPVDSTKHIPMCKDGEVCMNINQYAFFDAIHPTEVMNSIMDFMQQKTSYL